MRSIRYSRDVDVIPCGLDAMEPGPALAAILSSIDVDEVSGCDRIVVLRAHQRMASHYQAHVYADMSSVVDAMADEGDDEQWAAESAAAEIRGALRLTRRAADLELALALDMRRRLPDVHAGLVAGTIDVRRARVIAGGTAHLPDAAAAAVATQALADAPRLTTGQLAALIRRLAVANDPEDARNRFELAVEQRRLVTEADASGTAHLLGLDLPPDRVSAVRARINRLARQLKTKDEARSMDQLRADVFLDLLAGKAIAGGARDGGVEIRVDLETLAGLSEQPGEVAGCGPVIADIARRVADQQHDVQWRYTVTDPRSGMPLACGNVRRRPTASQRRQVEALYPTCVFPGCRMPARGCDLDHRIPWAEGGSTTVESLGPLCRHDHVIRHGAGWRYRRLPNGDHEWTTRFGHTYTTSGLPP